jgi:hypothetical protein
MSERFMVAVLKTAEVVSLRGFESLSLRRGRAVRRGVDHDESIMMIRSRALKAENWRGRIVV